MSPEAQERVNRIGTSYKWIDVSGGTADFSHRGRDQDLTIARGTPHQRGATDDQSHIVATIKMLGSAAVAQAPEPRCRSTPAVTPRAHGRKGYPRGLKREQMSVQARVNGKIADISRR